MLTFEQIKELIELVASHRMTGIELERSGFRLTIDGYRAAETVQAAAPAAPAATAPAAPAAPPPSASPAASADASEDEEELGEDLHTLTSPIVGTFYRSPNPEAPAFVKEGDTVKKGQVLCIVEAMKLMNEIESDTDGEVVRILCKNGQPVEFGEPLFAIRPA